jgi:DNA-binding MarR family transcriptional regulator
MKDVDGYLDNCMYFTAARLHRALERMAEDCFAAAGLAPSQAFLLMMVQDRPGIGAGELARALHLAPSTLSRFLDKVEALGLAKRSKEGRNAVVSITAKGRKLRKTLDSGWDELYRRYCGILGETEAKRLTSVLLKTGDSLEKGA